MQDRNVEFPNRFRMVKVEGTDDIYDVIPAPGEVLNPGTLLNKANLLSDETARLLGMEQNDPTVNEAFGRLNKNLIEKPASPKIASYETAGAFEWTAPDLADGKAYKIGVLIIGGGGSGGMNAYAGGSDHSSKVTAYALGGGSGYTKHLVLVVSPNTKKNIVVGAGGAPLTSYASSARTGGSSSFDGVTVDGGGAGSYQTSNSNAMRVGGSRGNGCGQNGSFGMAKTHFVAYYSEETPWQCVNLFEGKEILGSGGSVEVAEGTGTITAYSGGKGPDGLGGGNGGATGGENATAPGCGGGATVDGQTTGAGADGAVYIYFLGVVDE